ncbi:MAG TPA: acyl-homoserine-lactone synthase [Acidocella sp.]|uniref:acyl-homoserine-lactone synthase n=1 Tax=Acidocella sp. TaxID=50710 RepID=UPI002BA5F7AC|nr:acyl-homoserine-lactone synthase [Acidocella sp.]HVE22230.1 acyl-homoserine-lactone synthase [Acidocella sp.]
MPHNVASFVKKVEEHFNEHSGGTKMIINLTHDDRAEQTALFDQMFQSRAAVFYERLGWDVTVKNGREIDRYDEEAAPLYLLAVDDDQRVLGSLRLLATTGPTMLRNEFAHFFDDAVDVAAPTIWECTRFCVPPVLDRGVQDVGTISAALLIGTCELCLASGIDYVVGVYEAPMARIYARIGWSPKLLARARPEIGKINVGIWEASPAVLSVMRQRRSARINGRQVLVT